jgi:hypothetical protein
MLGGWLMVASYMHTCHPEARTLCSNTLAISRTVGQGLVGPHHKVCMGYVLICDQQGIRWHPTRFAPCVPPDIAPAYASHPSCISLGCLCTLLLCSL